MPHPFHSQPPVTVVTTRFTVICEARLAAHLHPTVAFDRRRAGLPRPAKTLSHTKYVMPSSATIKRRAKSSYSVSASDRGLGLGAVR